MSDALSLIFGEEGGGGGAGSSVANAGTVERTYSVFNNGSLTPKKVAQLLNNGTVADYPLKGFTNGVPLAYWGQFQSNTAIEPNQVGTSYRTKWATEMIDDNTMVFAYTSTGATPASDGVTMNTTGQYNHGAIMLIDLSQKPSVQKSAKLFSYGYNSSTDYENVVEPLAVMKTASNQVTVVYKSQYYNGSAWVYRIQAQIMQFDSTGNWSKVGSAVVIDSSSSNNFAYNYKSRAVQIDTNKIMIAYEDNVDTTSIGGATGRWTQKAVCISVSGTTISVGNIALTTNYGASNTEFGLVKVGAGRALMSAPYYDTTASAWRTYLYPLTVSGTTTTVGTGVSSGQASDYDTILLPVDDTRAVLRWSNQAVVVQLGTGAVVSSVGAQFTVPNYGTSPYWSNEALIPTGIANKFMFVDYGRTGRMWTISGTTITESNGGTAIRSEIVATGASYTTCWEQRSDGSIFMLGWANMNGTNSICWQVFKFDTQNTDSIITESTANRIGSLDAYMYTKLTKVTNDRAVLTYLKNSVSAIMAVLVKIDNNNNVVQMLGTPIQLSTAGRTIVTNANSWQGPEYHDACYVNDHQVAVVWTEMAIISSTYTYYKNVVIVDISNDTLTTSPVNTFYSLSYSTSGSSWIRTPRVTALKSDRIIVAWDNIATSGTVSKYVTVYKVDGTKALTKLGSDQSYSQDTYTPQSEFRIFPVDSTKVLLLYSSDNTNSNLFYALVVRVLNDTITFGTATQIAVNHSSPFCYKALQYEKDKFAIAYYASGGINSSVSYWYLTTIQIVGTTINTLLTPVSLDYPTANSWNTDLVRLAEGKMLFMYNNRAYQFIVTDQEYSRGAEFFICISNWGTNPKGINISDGKIFWINTKTDSEATSSPYWNVESGYLYSEIGQILGVSNTSNSVVLKGIVEGMSGLATGSKYYSDANGNLILNGSEAQDYIGLAISPTALLIKDYLI